MLTLAFAVPTYFGDVLPIFAKHCLGCHAAGVKMGSLDLESWEGVQRGGNQGTIVVKGKPAESRLYTMLMGQAAPAMPMDGKILPAAQVEVVRKWIELGAEPGGAAAAKAKPAVYSLAWRPGANEVAVGRFKDVAVIEAAEQRERFVLTGHAEAVRAVAFSGDGKLLAAAGGVPGRKGEVKIWSLETQQAVQTISGHADCLHAVVFSPDGKTLATASYDKLIKLWDVASGKEIRTLKDHIDAVYALAFTPDGKRLVSGAIDRTVKIWNPETGERLYTLSEPADGINAVTVSPDGQRVAAAGADKQIRVWKLGEKAGELQVTQIAHEDQILRLAFAPDGKTLVSASTDRTVKFFSATDLKELRAIGGQSDWIFGLAFSPDGKRLAAGRLDGSISFYDHAH